MFPPSQAETARIAMKLLAGGSIQRSSSTCPMLMMQNHRGSQINRRFSHFFVPVDFAKASAPKVA